jgi:HK97 family phage portal protein
VVEEKKGNEWTLLENTSLHDLMNKPNMLKGYTWNDIEEMMLIYLLTTGNTYMVGNTQINATLIEEVDILPSQQVCIEMLNKNFFMPEIEYYFEMDNREYDFTKEQIAHIKLFNPSFTTTKESLYGLSPIQVAAKVVQTGNDRWDADANLLQNRGAIGLITDKSQRPMLPDEAAKVQADFDNQTAGTRNFGKVKVTNKDLAYIQMAMSSVDLQLIEKGVVNLRAICNVFGLDSSLFNDPENKTYNNRREAERALYTNAVMPVSDKIAEQLTMFLCPNHFPNRTVRMRQDFSKVEALQSNFQEESGIYANLKGAGIISSNTAAAKLGLPLSLDPNAELLSSGSKDNLGKIPLALQQLAMARERATANGDTVLSESLGRAMDILTAQLVTTII